MIQKFGAAKVVERLKKTRFPLDNILKIIEDFKDQKESLYFQEKAYEVYFNLRLVKLDFEKTIEITKYQQLENIIREKGKTFKSLETISKKINEIISRKSENMMCILTSKPLGWMTDSSFHPDTQNIIRFPDMMA